MRSIKHILLALIILFPSYAFSHSLGMMRTSLIEGDVQIYSRDADDWIAVSINMPLLEGDRIWVPTNARLEIHAMGKTYIRLDENTSFDILTLEEKSIQFYLARGHVYINDRKGGTDIIQIDTPLASVSIYDNSIAMIDVSEDGQTEVSVLKGDVYVEGLLGKTRVEAGRSILIGEDRYAELSPLGPADEWERWNRQRDKRLYEDISSRYLPDELREYSYDLSSYGRWVYTRDYGYVWTPTVIISAGWAPYRVGRWVWLGGHYVWISYEPWGWVPYHYGRWTFIIGIGWCWVPPFYGSVYWGPGYVGWVYTPTYVAWVPLAPGEIYYGYGYYGPWSVNIVNINIQHVVIKQYKNVVIKDAVTVVHKDTFVKGKKVDFKVDENPFKKEQISIGPPDIKPEKETSLPIIKQIPEFKKPSKKLQMIDIENIKRERRLTKGTEASAFKPDKKIETMPVKEFKEPKKTMQREKAEKRIEPETMIEMQEKRPAPDKKIEIERKRPTPEAEERHEYKRPRIDKGDEIRKKEPAITPETKIIPQVPMQKEQKEKKIPESKKEKIEDASRPTPDDASKEEIEKRKKRKELQDKEDKEIMQPIPPSRPQ